MTEIEYEEVTIDGVTYVVQFDPLTDRCCEKCVGAYNNALCHALPPCTKSERQDGKPIVWVKKDD